MDTHLEMVVAHVDKVVLFVEMLVVLVHALVVDIVDVDIVDVDTVVKLFVGDHMHVVMVAVYDCCSGAVVCWFIGTCVFGSVMRVVNCKFALF